MNPITYLDQDLKEKSTKYQSHYSTIKKKRSSNCTQKNQPMIIKRKQSLYEVYNPKLQQKPQTYKQPIKNKSTKNIKKTSISHTANKSPIKQPKSQRNNLVQTYPVESLNYETYILELEHRNIQNLNTINLLHDQIMRKDLLLDQCQNQLSFLKSKFTHLFTVYNQEIKQLQENKRNIQDHKQTKKLHNSKIQQSQIQQDQKQIMKRIQYSQDTLKLSLASSIAHEPSLMKSSRKIIKNNLLQQSTIRPLQSSQFQFFDTAINDDSLDGKQSLHGSKVQERRPLQALSIDQQQNFLKQKMVNQCKANEIFTLKENANLIPFQPKYLAQSQVQNAIQTQKQANMSRKNSLSAITATHRLADFYKKHQ